MRGGGARRRLLTFFVLAVGIVAVLPFAVVNTPLRNTLLSAALPSDARVTASGGSFSWAGGASLSGVEVRDAAGNVLLVAEKVSIDRAPGNLLLNPRDLGTIEVSRPTLHLQIRPDGSNLEDLVEKLLADVSPNVAVPTNDGAGKPLAYAVYLIDGTVVAQETATGRQWRADKLDIRLNAHGANGGLGYGSLSGQLTQGGDGAAAVPAGRFSVELKPDDAGKNQLTLQADGVSLAIAGPWLRRFADGGELSGTLSGQGRASWSQTTAAPPSDFTTSGVVTIERLDTTAPVLQGDRVRLARVEFPWRVASQPSGLVIEDLRMRSDIGQAAVRGRLDPNLVAARHDIELRSSIDLARLATMLPHALRIRANTTVTSGTIELAGRAQPNENGQLITGSVRTNQLAATNAGKPLRWDQPVDVKFALRRAGDTMQLENLQCDSKFLQINASGTPQQFSAKASFDLNSLADQLGQFVDLSGVQLAGTGEAKIAWQQQGSDQFSATALADLAQLSVSLPDGAVWEEPQLAVRAEAAGLLDPLSRRLTRVDAAKLLVDGQGDQLDARLTSAVALAGEAPQGPVEIRASGRISRWLTRARPWFAPGEWQIDGQSELSTSVRVAGRMFEATNTKVVVTDLRANAPGWNINEPRVELAGDARWDGASNEVTTSAAQLVTTAISLATRDIRYRAGEGAINQLTGVAAFRADVARLASWKATPNSPPQYQPKGQFTGNIRFAQQADQITGELSATGQNLSLASFSNAAAPANLASRGAGTAAQPGSASSASGYQTIWQEPNLTLRGNANYQSSSDRLTFDQFQIQSNTLQATAGGTIDKLSSAADVNVSGTLNYDLAQVTPLLQPYIGRGIQLTGREQARFALAGKLSDENGPRAQLTSVAPDPYRATAAVSTSPATHWSRRVRAQLDLPWTGANVYGLPVGAGRLAANLGEGAIHIEPLSLAIGEGRLTAAPTVRFDPEPAELTMPAGPLVTNVRISPEVSEAMLKYVAPVLAGSTQSEGQFSMQLDGVRVPLAESKRADAAGRLSVHSVRVVPGPMARELVGLAQQVEALAKRRDPTALAGRSQVTLLNIRDQQVNFRVLDGRVHHQNLEFQVGDVTMRSQGSVGFDQTIQLTLHVPIQDAWVGKEPLLAGLKGQSLQVPMSGTLTRPQLDQRAIASLSQQLLQGAAQNAIGGELNKALDKLFKSR
jgi:hypothetical protein